MHTCLYLVLCSETCPSLQSVPASPERRKDRYAVKPTRELSSKFLRRQEAKEKAKLEEEERKRREEELSKAAVSSMHDSHNYVHACEWQCNRPFTCTMITNHWGNF